jgi:hypothetical protein
MLKLLVGKFCFRVHFRWIEFPISDAEEIRTLASFAFQPENVGGWSKVRWNNRP